MPPPISIKQAPEEVIYKLLVPELIEYNATHLPECDAFIFESPIGSKNLAAVSWKIFNEAVKKGADYVSTRIAALDTKPVVGVLANIDSMTFTALLGGLWLAGAIPFLISTRNSPAAVARLITETNAAALIVSGDEQMQSLAAAALHTISGSNSPSKVALIACPSYAELYAAEYTKTAERKMPNDTFETDTALIMHSSGSTAFPKPITIEHRVLRQWALSFRQPGATMSRAGMRTSAHALPMFHAMGVAIFLCSMGVAGSLGVFPPSDKPTMPSPDLLLNGAVETKCDIVITVPSLLEGWSRDPEAVQKLKTFDLVGFGGGPLGRDFGNALWKQGVKIVSAYGATESGIRSVFFPEPYPEWEYIHLLERSTNYFRPIEDEPGHYEIIFLENEERTPSVFNTEVNGIRGYATSDMVERHPTDPMKMRILGRIDDQIMLSTGEKTNPGPLEAIISRNALVSGAIIFGRGREQNGVIVQPVVAIDHTDQAAVSKFRNDIWPSIEESNRYAPTHSRIFKEMIIVGDVAKPFQYTPKRTIKRKATLADYESEIEATYAAVEESAQGTAGPSDWLPNNVREFVRQVVEKVMERKLGDEDDIFLHGGDSLRATWIRNSLLHAIRQSPHASNAHAIGQGFVFNNPTIAALASSIQSLVGAEYKASTAKDDTQMGIEEIESLVAAYTQNFPTHTPDVTRAQDLGGEVVLVTGTTGGLGAQLVATLAAKSTVARVYAFNRPAQQPIAERQRKAFSERGLDTALLDGGKVVLVEGNTEGEHLGISRELFNEMRDSITLIIHNAWRVNFVLGLSAFSPLIKGARNLVDFSLSSPRANPPRVIFTSTVSVVLNWDSDKPPHEGPVETRIALSSGYSRSKYVVERILEAAAAWTPLKPVIVRVGQMTGTASGAWNKTDWLPAIVRSGQVIGVLPDRDDDVAWFSLDLAANAIYEFRTTESTYLNLEHPTPYPWSSIFHEFSRRLSIPLVPWPEWLAKLEEATDRDPGRMAKINPASMLVTFFKAATTSGTPGKEAPGNVPFLSLEKALASSPSLRKARDETIDIEGDVGNWVAHWKTVGLLD